MVCQVLLTISNYLRTSVGIIRYVHRFNSYVTLYLDNGINLCAGTDTDHSKMCISLTLD